MEYNYFYGSSRILFHQTSLIGVILNFTTMAPRKRKSAAVAASSIGVREDSVIQEHNLSTQRKVWYTK